MATMIQKKKLYEALKTYKKKYLVKKYADLDESATRLMVNSFLTDVLGYAELEEIRTEYSIKGTYADYVIQIARKKHFIVEVKAIQLDLSENHLRQAVNYAANEGIDWVLLTNGRQFALYKVIFGKPITYKKIFDFNLIEHVELKNSVDFLIYITKPAMVKNEINKFWTRFQAMEPINLCKYLYSKNVINYLRRVLRQKSNLSFSEDDILDSVHQIITKKINSVKPKHPIEVLKKRKKSE